MAGKERVRHEVACAQCGKRFLSFRNRPRKYCSRQCSGIAQRGVPTTPPSNPDKKAEVACPTCGKRFSYYRSWPRKYCSNACKGRANAANLGTPMATRYETTCEHCGKPFTTVPSQHARFCSRTCFGAWKSIHVRGAAHPQYGKRAPSPPNKKAPVPLVCPVCGDQFLVKHSQAARRRYCSKECMAAAYAVRNSGEHSPTWQGGYEPYYGPSWRPAMRFVRARDQVCQQCGASPETLGRELDVHHRVPFRFFGIHRHAEANEPGNLIALCNSCHLREEWRENRRTR